MTTYWDLTEQQRAALTETEVTALLDVELMTKGVKKPVRPVFQDVPKSPLGLRKTFFRVVAKGKYGTDERLDPAFATTEQAAQFIALNPLKADYDYEVGSEFEYAIPLTSMKIEPVEFYGLDQINEFRVELKSRKAKTTANEEANRKFQDASKKAGEVTSRIWEDWQDQRQTLDQCRGIVATYGEYLRMTGGNAGMSLLFLAKVHSAEEIETARQWLPGQIPAKSTTPEEEHAAP